MAVAHEREKNIGEKKWVFGCCGGCIGLVIVAVIVVGLVLYFLLRSRPVLPPETFLTPGADAFLVARVNPNDKALITLIQESARQQGQQVPQAAEIAERLEKLTPIQLVLAARHTEQEGQFAVGGVASIKPWSGIVRAAVKMIIKNLPDEGGSIEQYKEIRIGVTKIGVCVAAVDNNFMLTQDKEMLKEWIDRIEEQEQLEEGGVLPYDGPVALKEMNGRLDPTAQARLVSLNDHGEIEALLDAVQQVREEERGEEERPPDLFDNLSEADVDWSRVSVVGGTVRILDPDTAGCELLIQCRAEEFAKGLAATATEMLEEQAEEGGLEQIEVTVDGAIVKVKFQVSGIQQMLREKAEQRRQSQPGRPPWLPPEPEEEHEEERPEREEAEQPAQAI